MMLRLVNWRMLQIPPKPEDFASWSPVEGDAGCAAIIDYWRSAGAGEPAINL